MAVSTQHLGKTYFNTANFLDVVAYCFEMKARDEGETVFKSES